MFEITIIFIQTDDIAYNQTVTEALNFLLGFLMNFIQIMKKIFPLHFKVMQEILMSKYQMLMTFCVITPFSLWQDTEVKNFD